MKLRLAQLTLPVAMVLFWSYVILGKRAGSSWGLLISAAGVPIATRGVLMLAYREEVMRPLALTEARGYRGKLGSRIETPYGALLLIVIGLGWVAFGLAVAF